jgi:DNA uptake protein ComE-like DNA-binding protein
MVPGINEELAGRIVQSRQSVGGFADLTDLSVTMGIAPPVLDESKEFLVFLRLPAA